MTTNKIVESNRIELKRELTEKFEKEVIAFLNYKDGGIIYIGIDDKTGKAIGIKDIDNTQLKIKDRLKNNILPSILGLFDVIVEKHNEKKIIKIIVAAGSERPYYLKKHGMSEKGCFVRIGSASEPMTTKMIEELFAKRTRTSIGKIESQRQELTFEQLQIYYNAKGFSLNEQFASNLELETKEKKFNYAAYLLADKNGNSIKVAKYSGKNRVDLIENNEYGYCSLIKASNQVLDKLDIENKTLTKITHKRRLEKRLIDPIALREAIVNAMVHNDYTNEVPPKFELFSDRIEITSTGGLPLGFNKEEFFLGFSYPRNKELMRIFKDLEFVEYLGSGIPRILEKYTEKAFLITENFLRITFPFENTEGFSMNQITKIGSQKTTQKGSQKTTQEELHKKTTQKGLDGDFQEVLRDNSAKITQKNTGETTQKGSQKTTKKGSQESSQKIIELIKNNPSITTLKMAKELKISQRAVAKQIAKLKNAGILKRVGADKGGHWKLI